MITENESKLLIINYHYIREQKRYTYPGIHPIEPKSFIKQVHWLKGRYHMATPDEVEAFAYGEETLPRASVLFTFDDGLVDHWTVVREILEPLGIKATFFFLSRPLVEKRAAMVHKIHWLRSITPPDRFQEEFISMLPDEWKDIRNDDEILKEATRIHLYDTPQIAHLKYLINFILPLNLMDDLSSEMLRNRHVSEDHFCRDLYMDDRKLKKLVELGHNIGNHGHSHTPFARLEKEDLYEEVQTSNRCLGNITGVTPCWISYPNGIQPQNSSELCRHFGLKIGVSLVRQWNIGDESPYLLHRINYNHIPELCM